MKTFKIRQNKNYPNGGHYVATNVKGLDLRAWAINDEWFTGEIWTKKGNLVFLMGTYKSLDELVKEANSFLESEADYINKALEAENA